MAVMLSGAGQTVEQIEQILSADGEVLLGGVPEGLDALVIGDLARALAARGGEGPALLVHVARDDRRMAAMGDALAFFAPDLEVLTFPAWDCLPFDRVGPNSEIVARRLATLTALAADLGERPPTVLLTTVNAALQRVPGAEWIGEAGWQARPGHTIATDRLIAYLETNGFARSSTVMEPGDYAVRGGIIDLYPPGMAAPVRLDLFGDMLESIRSFDPETQRTTGQLHELTLTPASEIALEEEAVRRFRTGYVARFGAVSEADPLYEAISAGHRYQGMEHWLALFHDTLSSLFDFIPGAIVAFDPQADDAIAARREQIGDYYQARADAREQETFGAPPYKPLGADELTLTQEEWAQEISARTVLRLSPFEAPGGEGRRTLSLGGRQGRSFAAEREQADANVFDALAGHITALQKGGVRVMIACWSEGSRERLNGVLADHGLHALADLADWREGAGIAPGAVGLGVLEIETGFESAGLVVIAEQDILGDRMLHGRKRRKRAADFLTEVTSLSEGDLVVHVDHGIGRFEGLRTIDVQGAPHDCLWLVYHGGDTLYLPVENIELLSRYGSQEAHAQLDRLGGAGWQARKAKLKERVKIAAEKLIETAAARELRKGDVFEPQEPLYSEFCARFPFEATDDQANAIDDVIADLGRGRPMDRLVCGDVGFGKTEIALRSAFVTVMAGKQVAVVVPTTLLARQHYETFRERFRGLPVNIAQASRMVAQGDLAKTRAKLASGEVDIIIGTHALLAKSIRFRDLGLLIVDEEQHFGVGHKERLKELRANVHVLTLTATPIPRTLQLALSGVRELSLIATPPVDRLAVRTFISPFDPVVIREALLRERFRGGQSFYVCPRISDLAETEEFLTQFVPEVKVRTAHGQMPSQALEQVMGAFYQREFDVLLSTTIIESGLDIPSANTLVVHRADMFGLGQLYQLRGRVGRSKLRAYALFTVPADKPLTAGADKRLKVLQSLDSLGAGFSLASHDLDIRGAGNLLGEEQSGHIREVGLELYQSMLEEAVARLREGAGAEEAEDRWSPQINIGTSVLIPERYVPDLDLRMGLYRRLAGAETQDDIDAFAAELADRFGPMPEEVEHLLQIVAIKVLCRRAGVSQLDAGPKGVVFTFHKERFANPEALIAYITDDGHKASLRPDHKLVFRRDWDDAVARLKGVTTLAKELVRIAEGEQVAA